MILFYSIEALDSKGTVETEETEHEIKLNLFGFGTMPRTAKSNANAVTHPNVVMRRSSSVPCGQGQGQSDRGSTSSSDSGFSAGSRSPPGQNAAKHEC